MRTVVILFFLCSFIHLGAQPPRKFHVKNGGNGYDCAYDLKQTLDKAFVLAGSTSSYGQGNTDIYLLKLDTMGQVKFETSFGHYNNERANSIVQTTDSGFVIAGFTNSYGIGGYDIYLLKTDKHANLLWEKTLGGNDWDFAYSVETTTDGGLIICGTTYSFGRGNADGYVIKTDAGGNVTWSKTYGGKYDDEFKSVIQASDGNYVLTGYTKSYNDTLGNCWAFKLDMNGDSLWSYTYGGNKEDFGNQIIENSYGDFYIAGATKSYGLGLLDAYALKISSSGNQLVSVTDGTAGNDEIFTSVAISKRTSVERVCFSEKEKFAGYDLQIKVMELDFGLNYKSASDHGAPQADETYKLIPTYDKGYAMAGYTYGYSSVLSDSYFIKIDSNLVGGPSIVSVREYNADPKFHCFPNPTSDVLNIKLLSHDIPLFKLYSISGNEVDLSSRLVRLSGFVLELSFADLPDGIYFLKTGNRTEKVVVIH